MSAPTIGIDIGGTKIAAAVVDESGTVVARTVVKTSAHDEHAIATAIVKVSKELLGSAPAAAAIGIGAAGLVDSENGVILGAPNLSYRDFPVRDVVSSRTGLPVVVENDANVATWGEAIHGAGIGVRDQVMVTIGTGIGGGLVLGSRLYRGAHGVGAELGHMVVAADGPVCGCGNRGCWEVMASGNAIGRYARERAADGAGSLVLKMAGDAESITGEIVGEAAKEGDDFALEVLREAGRWLGVGLGSLVNIFDPELIVVGGGAGTGTGSLLLDPAIGAMNEHIIGREWRPPVRVTPAKLGYEAGVVGAAALARDLL